MGKIWFYFVFMENELETFLLDVSVAGLPPAEPRQPGAREGCQVLVPKSKEDRKDSLGDIEVGYSKAYPKIHFLDHLLGVTLQNHAVR